MRDLKRAGEPLPLTAQFAGAASWLSSGEVWLSAGWLSAGVMDMWTVVFMRRFNIQT